MRLDVQRLSVVLAAVSLVALAAVAATAAVVLPRDGAAAPVRPDGPPAGWGTVGGQPGRDGEAVSYAVPDGAAWESGRAEDEVSYRDAGGTPYAQGHAPSLYYGNGCTSRGRRHPAAWVLLGDPAADQDLTAFALRSARAWARGYGGGAARASAPATTRLALVDGTPAVRADVRVDLSGFEGECLGTRGDVSVLAFRAGEEVRSLVVARFIGVTGGLRSQVVEAILGSVVRSS